MPTRTVTRNLHVVGTTVTSGTARRARPRSAETLSVPCGRGPGPSDADPVSGPLLDEHVVGDHGLRVGDAEVLGPLVGHGQQPADPPGDGVLGHRRGPAPRPRPPRPPP